MGTILREILNTQAHVATGRLVLWTLIGLAAGLVLAWLWQRIAGRLGAWDLEWAYAGVLRILSALWMYTGLSLLLMSIGFAEGGLRGVDVIVRHSQFRHAVLERAAGYGSLGVAWIDLYLAGRETAPPMSAEERERRWGAFTRGEAELDAAKFLSRLETSQATLVQEAVEAARTRLRALEGYGGGLMGRLVELSLAVVTHRYTRDFAAYLLGKEGADVSSFFKALPAAAAAAGSPGGLTHRELQAHIVERVLIPNIMGPTRIFVRSNQVLLAALLPVVVLPSLLLFWIARVISRATRPAATPGPGSDR
jgi:hypothetical protein